MLDTLIGTLEGVPDGANENARDPRILAECQALDLDPEFM